MTALIVTRLHDRRRSPLAWGLPLGLMSAFIVAIFPSVEDALGQAIRDYPSELKEAFGIGELATVEQYLEAEMLSLIVPLALGYLAVRSIADGLSGAAETGRLDVLVSRSRLAGAGLAFGPALAGFANVWPLALVFAGLGVIVTGLSLRTSVVTGSVAGALVAMYVIDLVGRLDTSLDWIRYGSVFRYYGTAIEDGVDPVAFCGVVAVALGLATIGAALFERRDLSD